MSDLLTEVDDMMRRERMEKVWNNYGAWIIAGLVAIIALTAAYAGYKSWNENVRKEQTARFIEMRQAGDYPENVLAAQELDLRSGIKGILYIDAAGKFTQSGETDKALTLYERAAGESGIPAEFSHLAHLMIVRLRVDGEDADADSLLSHLSPVYSDADSPWSYHARLEAALVEARLNSDPKAAIDHLDVIITAANAPQSLKERATALKHVYGLIDTNTNTETSEESTNEN